MKNKKWCILLFLAVVCTRVCAQMEFNFSNLSGEVKKSVQLDGSILYQMPSGTDLTQLSSYGMSATVNGVSVDCADIHPNPSTTFITDGEIEVFVYEGKAYSFRFTEGAYFTAILFSDPHVAQDDGTSVEAMQGYVQNMVNMGKEGGKQFRFSSMPSYVPTADIVFCLGDMDKDSESSGSNFKNAIAGFNNAQVPFITLVGNHDLLPDYWHESAGADAALTLLTASQNTTALGIVTDQLNKAKGYDLGITVTRFTDGTSHTQAEPFVLTYKGVQFYCGQTYWFQKPYSIGLSTTYYAPDGVIASLEEYVKNGAGRDKAAVWMQHYPFLYGSDCDRWWLDQNDGGKTIAISDATDYPTAADKKQKLSELIKYTKNPVHFSGHVHSSAKYTYNGIDDYTIGNTLTSAAPAYILLCKENVGVVEIKEVSFK